jgi:hypothetical protein
VFLQTLAARGVLRAQPEDLERLVVNAWIVGIYWVAYVRSRQGARAITRAHLQWGFAQVEFLFAPYTNHLRGLTDAQKPLAHEVGEGGAQPEGLGG